MRKIRSTRLEISDIAILDEGYYVMKVWNSNQDEVVLYLKSKDEYAIMDRQRLRHVGQVEYENDNGTELPQGFTELLHKQASIQTTANEAV